MSTGCDQIVDTCAAFVQTIKLVSGICQNVCFLILVNKLQIMKFELKTGSSFCGKPHDLRDHKTRNAN